MKSLFTFTIIFISNFFNSQTFELENKKLIEKIGLWDNGIFFAHGKGAMNGSTAIKNYDLTYYSEDGSKAWESEVKTYNSKNNLVCDANSNYAYIINNSWFDLNTIYEKRDTDNPFRIYRIDKSGKSTETVIAASQIKPIEGKKIVTFVFGFATENKLTFLIRAISPQNKKTAEFFLIQVNEDNSVISQKIEGMTSAADLSDDEGLPKMVSYTNDHLFFTRAVVNGGISIRLYDINLSDLSTNKVIQSDVNFSASPKIGPSLGVNFTGTNTGPDFEGCHPFSTTGCTGLEGMYENKLFENQVIVYGCPLSGTVASGIWYFIMDLNGDEEQNVKLEVLPFAKMAGFPKSNGEPIRNLDVKLEKTDITFAFEKFSDKEFYTVNKNKVKKVAMPKFGSIELVFEPGYFPDLSKYDSEKKYSVKTYFHNFNGNKKLIVINDDQEVSVF